MFLLEVLNESDLRKMLIHVTRNDSSIIKVNILWLHKDYKNHQLGNLVCCRICSRLSPVPIKLDIYHIRREVNIRKLMMKTNS